MSKSAFVSFYYDDDSWRVQQVLRMGAIDGQEVLSPQRWEQVKAPGPAAVEGWIDREMAKKSAVVVLVGSNTASRRYVKYEIRRAWSLGKPLLGVQIHGLRDSREKTSAEGANPFAQFGFSNSTRTYADYAPLFRPSGRTSQEIYASIKANLAGWVSQGYAAS